MYSIEYTNRFKKDVIRCRKQGKDISLLQNIILQLAKNGKLPKQNKPHKLKGKFAGMWECHIQPDWLLVWEQQDNILRLVFTNTGSHSEIF